MRQLDEVRILNDTEHCLDLYRQEYRKRYGILPSIDPTGRDHHLMKELIRSHSSQEIQECVIQYLKMTDDWFLKQAHSLNTFKNSINIVRGKAIKREKVEGKGNQMMVPVACDKCRKLFQRAIPLHHNFDDPVICMECL